MAFFKGGKNKKTAKGLLLGMGLMTVISVCIIGVLYLQHIKITDNYKEQVIELERVFKEETSMVVRLIEPMKAGQKFNVKNVEMVSAPKFVTPENAVKRIENLEDKVSKLDIQPNTTLLETMLVEESIPKNAREVELNMLLLPSNLTNNHYMDIRIGFPTGQDYVVISKKKVRDIFLKENTVWLWLSEREILELSSSIIDAYLREGAKLYCVTYIDPMFQDKSITNYPENLFVQDLIKKDPNILDRAMEGLAEEIRMDLENSLNSITKDDTNKIKGNIINEKSKRGTQVQEKIRLESETVDQTGDDIEFFND